MTTETMLLTTAALLSIPDVYDDLDDDFYPEADGKPMAENDAQYTSLVSTRFALEYFYRDSPEVYVGANMLIYYEPGNQSNSVAPDVFVVMGVAKRMRRRFLIWKEGQVPAVVFEIASPSTWRADVSWKRGLYQGLGVQEYFLFDPSSEHLKQPLQGLRLDETGIYQPIPMQTDTERGAYGVQSDELGLELWAQANDNPDMPYVLRFFHPATGTWLPTPEGETRRAAAEAARAAAETQARVEAEARAAAETQARVEAEARLQALEAEIKRLRGV